MGDVGEGAGGGQHGVSERPEGILLHQGSLAVPESSAGSGDESVDPSEPISDEVHQADRLGARFKSLAPIIIFDVVGPLAVYYAVRSVGVSTVIALVVSGVLPALHVGVTVIRHHRLDALGALVLSGIALGTVVGVASGNARLYLLDGIVPTVVLGFVCLASLLSAKPMMYRLAIETMGENTQQGHALGKMWGYPEFRRIFRIITLVWGLVFLAESALQATIVERTSINTAKQTSNLLPVVVVVLTFVWTRWYGRHMQHRNEQS